MYFHSIPTKGSAMCFRYYKAVIMKNNVVRLFQLLLMLFVNGVVHAQDYTISSPDSNILVQITTGDQLAYSIAYKNTLLVLSSPLGFEFKNEPAMQTGFTVIDKKEQV